MDPIRILIYFMFRVSKFHKYKLVLKKIMVMLIYVFKTHINDSINNKYLL